MCGIIAVVRNASERSVPDAATVLEHLDGAGAALRDDALGGLLEAAGELAQANRLLSGSPGLRCLLADADLAPSIVQALAALAPHVAAAEEAIDGAGLSGGELEQANARLIEVKDAVWAIERDRLRTATAVDGLGASHVSTAGIDVLLSAQQALSAIDRLEVRGRDSAGLHFLVREHGLDLPDPAISAAIAERSADPLFRDRSVRQLDDGQLAFVYKAAAEIGELGDNTAHLRKAISEDELLQRALRGPDVECVVLGHTRWASVGIISEANAHPLNSDRADGEACPYVSAALNGDVDNFADIVAVEGLSIDADITTDAKVIPTLTAKHLSEGHALAEAFRRSVASFEGSVAIAANAADVPGHLQLALRGSGQALYVGFAEDCFIVASEPYGVVEETSTYLRMDGETPANPDNPTASRGQIIDLDAARAGSIEGIERLSYDGTVLPVTADELVTAEITTRDIDRGNYPHFLLKEISEAPSSFRKTLRGKLHDEGDHTHVRLGDSVLPSDLRDALGSGQVTRIYCIGQGTAAIAAQSAAAALSAELEGTAIRAEAIPATELSGFALRSDMSDSLAIAISQSGTTTDTNRTVDLIRARGGRVVAIVNRRNSDLTDKADGVLYTSDGRDVEMSVASTKAFYSQVAAGFLLAAAIADAAGAPVSAGERTELLRALRAMPDAMERTLALHDEIGEAAQRFAPARRYWAIVGNGPNLIAAKEIRIKLSELCYKSIAHDATEDKKHIDLSSEPLILVCAAGLVGSTADDVAKEVAIYKAHKAAPIVIANEGETRFTAALDAISVPAVHPRLAFILSTVVGHLFGYEAAKAIDAQARPLREARALIEAAAAEGVQTRFDDDRIGELRVALRPHATAFFDDLRAGHLNGHMEASTAARISSLFRFALGDIALESYQLEFGKIGTPSLIVDDLASGLAVGIEELTRPIDAIKHQAKTVTVGISRSDESLLETELAAAVIDAGAPRDRLSYNTLRTLAGVDPAVSTVLGFTRYRIDGVADDEPTATIVDRGGISLNIPSRTDRDPTLRGTKRRVASERQVLVTRGDRDDRTIVIVPEVKDNQTTGITLLQVQIHDRLPLGTLRGVLQSYRNRFGAIRDVVTETEPSFRDDLLADMDVTDLLTHPVRTIADTLRG